MREVLLLIAAALAIALYRMISKGGKKYAYSSTRTIAYLDDGSEQNIIGNETGSIIITNKTVILDGREYCYKPMGNELQQAALEYDDEDLSGIRVFLSHGEKVFLIKKVQMPANKRPLVAAVTLS
jgi:hypothetical protein